MTLRYILYYFFLNSFFNYRKIWFHVNGVNNCFIILYTFPTIFFWHQSISFPLIFLRSSLIYNASDSHDRRKCHKNETGTTWVLHEWKILIFITILVKTYFHTFHTLIFIIWQVKDYIQRNNVILTTTFCKCLGPMPKCVWKVHHKNGIL